ncbi:CRISPR-associated endoribonuclease Cas6 [Streptomyces sp. NBC_01803]|uniref:CRISPR-associated endoribonuclease Cas6 n=1 Tax=Streptomyces sp. NBC_01803 TaxID=2975946 RepID=UPI002DD9CE1F|nr:CRISPR-associated endoribonuclease Cas6 [Streptomyces sp. NBC_01803]WSA44216.1 hypothetical protein OIE51_08350 [Streptomyces sp. NBC_01803]
MTTSATVLPWAGVLAPGRGLVYDVLGRVAPELGRRLHAQGMGRFGMVPFGHGAPVFPRARRVRGKYAAGGPGVVEFGSPVPEVVEALGRGLAARELVDWGGVAFRLTGLEVLVPPDCSSGRVRLRTVTPVVMKGSGRDESGARESRQDWVLPSEPQWAEYFQGNLVRKAQTLGLDPAVELESVTWIGAKRSFTVGGGAKPGAPVEVELSGAPETLRALWSWGLGQANAAGFGWVQA